MITFMLAVCGNVDYVYSFPQSPPSRAAWIEILIMPTVLNSDCCRRLHGRRGLKSFNVYINAGAASRRLHGRRGLKFFSIFVLTGSDESPPSRAAWIEIRSCQPWLRRFRVAAFTGGVD